MKKRVFLGGPIRGVDRSHSLGWRESVGAMLPSFDVVNPLRGREERETMPNPRSVIWRDKNDIAEADILLVDDSVPGASMIGSAMEVMFAHALGKLVVVFGRAHSPDYWLDEHAHIRTDTLDEAVEILERHFASR